MIDQPPLALSPPPAVSAFQGLATGPLTLGAFTVSPGAESGPGQYTAVVNWGDGANPEAALVAVSGSTVTVSSAGHRYTQTGAAQGGAKNGEFHPIVTLNDDTGGSATIIDTINVAPDVSNQVRVVGLGGPLNPATRLISSAGTIANVGGAVIPGPLYLIVHGLPAGVTLANSAGSMFSGEPFYVVDVSQLQPGQTFAAVTLAFSDPALAPFTYSVTVIDGPAGGSAPAGTIAAPGATAPGFMANDGQTDSQARFLSQGNGYTLFLTSTGAVLGLLKPGSSGAQSPSTVALGLEFVGASSAAEPVGLDPLTGSTNYMIGNDPSRWRTNVPSFGQVEYRDIYPGITLDYHSTSSRRLEYDFAVAAGADAGLIRLDVQGADTTTLDASGNLVLHTAAGDVVEQAPVMYQQIDGARRAVAGGYVILPTQDPQSTARQVGFRIGAYDRSRPLIIDPVLVYSTYLGGNDLDAAKSVAMDAAGNTYLTGYTSSTDFPS